MSWIGDLVRDATQSSFYKSVISGTVYTGTLVLIAFCILLVLVGVTFLLRQFFKRHPLVNRAHKILIYLLTMTGVMALFIGGIVGILLPIIPGVLFIFIGLLLMRKYHRWKWLDRQMGKARRSFKKTDIGSRYFAWRAQRRRLHEERLRQKLQEKINKARKGRRQ